MKLSVNHEKVLLGVFLFLFKLSRSTGLCRFMSWSYYHLKDGKLLKTQTVRALLHHALFYSSFALYLAFSHSVSKTRPNASKTRPNASKTQ